MKCTNCGKNIASYHYKYNINGKVTEAHLCTECAAELGEDQSFFGLGRFFSASFDPLDRLFDSFFRPFTFAPAYAAGIAADEEEEIRQTEPAPQTPSGSAVDPELNRRREINALKIEMLTAAQNEEYERAAELRDRLRELEK